MGGFIISYMKDNGRSSSRTLMIPSYPGMTLTFALIAVLLLSSLSPITSMAWVLGPMKATPLLASSSANILFSDKKP